MAKKKIVKKAAKKATSKVTKKTGKKAAKKASKKAASGPIDTHLIDLGKKAPAFSSTIQDGSKRSLKDYKGKWLVLYFYPKDDTPGCTKEACAFRDMLPDFSALDAEILGVSPDPETRHQKFIDKYELPFDLLVDTDTTICQKFGVWQEKKNYGRTYMGVVRTTYLIDPDGKIAQRWDKVRVKDHVEAVFSELQSKQAG